MLKYKLFEIETKHGTFLLGTDGEFPSRIDCLDAIKVLHDKRPERHDTEFLENIRSLTTPCFIKIYGGEKAMKDNGE